jgi:hypothetical protein
MLALLKAVLWRNEDGLTPLVLTMFKYSPYMLRHALLKTNTKSQVETASRQRVATRHASCQRDHLPRNYHWRDFLNLAHVQCTIYSDRNLDMRVTPEQFRHHTRSSA